MESKRVIDDSGPRQFVAAQKRVDAERKAELASQDDGICPNGDSHRWSKARRGLPFHEICVLCKRTWHQSDGFGQA